MRGISFLRSASRGNGIFFSSIVPLTINPQDWLATVKSTLAIVIAISEVSTLATTEPAAALALTATNTASFAIVPIVPSNVIES